MVSDGAVGRVTENPVGKPVRKAAANPAVESLADFIIPKAAANSAARTLSVKGSSKPFICQKCMTEEPGGPAKHHCYEVCQRNKRIRELEAELAKWQRLADDHAFAQGEQTVRAERAETRVAVLETAPEGSPRARVTHPP